MTREEKLRMAKEIREGMLIDPVIPKGFEQYFERVETKEMFIPTSQGDAHVYHLKEKNKQGILPLFINIHGGGFVRPHLSRDHLFASRITCEVGCVTLDLDYRLAPEYPYPTAVNECYDVVKWAIDHAKELEIDPKRVIVGGHSSGGNLTAALCLKANQTKEFTVKLQILDYPVLDMYTDPSEKTKNEEDPVISSDRAKAYNSLYFDDDERAREAYASPVFADDEMLRGLPETLVITAGEDMLRHEGEMYAQKLVEAGVCVTAQRILGCKHGFMTHCKENYIAGHNLFIQTMQRACVSNKEINQ